MTLKPRTALTAPDHGTRLEILSEAPINVQYPEYGAIGDGVTDDTDAINRAIVAANTADGEIVFPPTGDYYKVSSTLTTLTGTQKVTGTTSRIQGSVDGDILVLKGNLKVVSGLYIVNTSTAITSDSAVLRVKNCAYGDFSDLFLRVTEAQGHGLMLEQEYIDADDAEILVHYGCWYNTFRNITSIYQTGGTTSNVGHGISFTVAASAVSVVDPPGETAGTYTGSCQFNTVNGFNIEGRARGINLDRASCNHFIGGQFIGCDTQVYGRTSNANTFVGTKMNQWTTNAFDLTGCFSTVILNPIPFNTGSAPWSLGTLGTRAVVVASDESVAANDSQALIGQAKIGRSLNLGATWLEVRNGALTGAAQYALAQNSAASGPTVLNAQSGAEAQIRVNNVERARFDATGFHLNGGIPAPVATYAASNVASDRTYDANATTTDELADVLGTLISDLRALGIVQ